MTIHRMMIATPTHETIAMQPANSLLTVPNSYIREILKAASSPDIISLAGGLPNPITFPLSLFSEAFTEIMSDQTLYQYGATEGYPPLHDALRTRYDINPSHAILITTGSQQALDILARSYINPGDVVVMEAPSYLGAMQVFALAQADIQCIEQNDNGPDLNQLETIFAETSPKFFYAVPDYHNPTGVCWSEPTRQGVASLCFHYNVTLIEDIPYRELYFNDIQHKLVSDYAPISAFVLRSFSKIASPGIRIGAVSATPDLLAPLIKIKQAADLHSSIPLQAAMAWVIEHPQFDSHLDTTRRLYAQQSEILISTLKAQLPYSINNNVSGGMFYWLKIPSGNAMAIAEECLSNGVAVVPSNVFYPSSYPSAPALRLNFTNAEPRELIQASEIITKVIKSALN